MHYASQGCVTYPSPTLLPSRPKKTKINIRNFILISLGGPSTQLLVVKPKGGTCCSLRLARLSALFLLTLIKTASY